MKKLFALLPAIIAILIFVGTMTSCSPPNKPADGAEGQATVEPVVAIAFGGAQSALVVLDKMHADDMASQATPTKADYEKAAATTERLKRARDGLNLVRHWLSGEASEGDAKMAMRDIITGLRLVDSELRARGLKTPADVETGLLAAEAITGTK